MTPLWAAPEVIRHERASIKADMWSYGILVWELITGLDITEFQPLAIAQAMQVSALEELHFHGIAGHIWGPDGSWMSQW